MGISLYGTVAVTVGSETRPVKGARERAVLAYLATRPREFVSADLLVECFWPTTPFDEAVRSLRVRVSNLRRMLAGSGAELESPNGGYLLRIESDGVDIFRFERLVAECRSSDPSHRLTILAEAEAVRTGTPLSEFTYDEFARPAIVADEELRLASVELRADALIALGRHDEAIAALRPEQVGDPSRESITRLLMRAESGSGRVGAALSTYRTLVAALAERGLEPSSSTRQLEENILLGDHEAGPARPLLPHRRPLVGRTAEIESLHRRLDEERWVSILGPGGVGKTAVAIEIGHRQSAVGGSVIFAELTTATDTRAIWSLVALGAGIGNDPRQTPLAGLAQHFARQKTLVVLDNCEHLLSKVRPLVNEILDASPTTAVLTTSRVAFAAPNESRFLLAPLDVPSDGATFAEVAASPAVELFVQRAKAIRPEFELEDSTAGVVGRLCRSLDGLPLALELAAAKTAVLAPRQLLEHLGDRLRILSSPTWARPAHQRTLEATIRWSVSLLSEPARDLLPRLAAFRGSFDLAATEAVAGPDLGKVAHISELVDHSLLQTGSPSDEMRYQMLESVRVAAWEMLTDRQRQSLVLSHGRYFNSVVDRIGALGPGPDLLAALRKADPDVHNLRFAFEAALADRPHDAARILAGGWRWWHLRGNWEEGSTLATRLLNHALPTDSDLRYRFYDAATRLILFGGTRQELWHRLDELDQLADQLGRDRPWAVRALAHQTAGDWEQAADLHRQQAAADRAAGRSARAALANIATVRTIEGRYVEAREAADAALAEALEHGEAEFDTTPVSIAELDLLEGEFQVAADRATAWFDHASQAGADAGFQIMALNVATLAFPRLGRFAAARSCLEQVLPLLRDVGSDYVGMTAFSAALLCLYGSDLSSAARLTAAGRSNAEGLLRPEFTAIATELEEAAKATGFDLEPDLTIGAKLGAGEVLRLIHQLLEEWPLSGQQ